MPHAAQLALMLDEEMLRLHGVAVSDPWVPDHALPISADLASQLCDRYLIKYVRKRDRERYSPPLSGIATYTGVHFVTTTAICRDELSPMLNLPPFSLPRYALILNPAQLTVHGPRRIRGGRGIEYVLLNGFPSDAVIEPGWPMELR